MWAAIANIFLVLAYFFNPTLRETQEKLKIWAVFNNLEEKLKKALLDKDMYMVEKVSHWLQEMRDKYSYLKGK